MYKILDRIIKGKGEISDLDLLDSVAFNICGRTICALGDAAAMPVQSFIKHFRKEFENYIKKNKE
jgi:NADH-quinone oxidoreductase subunit F